MQRSNLPTLLSEKVLAIAKNYLQRDPREYYDIELLSLEAMQKLNSDTRGIDKPTNILSFPSQIPQQYCPGHLGDLALCPEVIEREAQYSSIGLEQHWAHIMLHGYLHLLGYDHEEIKEAQIMEQLEITILALARLPNPYTKLKS
jgi:probable rRNA maturation factor